MFSLFPRSIALRNWPLSLGLLFVATPLISPAAKAQTASAKPDASLKPEAANAVDAPLLTGTAPRPGSAISTSQRSSLKNQRWLDRRTLVMSLPDSPLTTKPLAAPAPTVSAVKPVQATRPVAVVLPVQAPLTTPNATPLSMPTVPPQLTSPKIATPKLAPAPKSVTPDRLAAVADLNPAPDWTTATTRDKAARLPARGGPITNPGAQLVNPPAATVGTPPGVSDSDKLMLAQLDADLAKAQKRLNRADAGLTEGQRQLGEFTGVLQSAMLDAGDDARGLHPFVRVAQRYLGTPYVWGGESARGFDCSGFIMRVMRDLGYRALPHSAAEQFHYGIPVAKELLKPGDVVFFANTYKPGISHVGIYLGKSRFIHAANSKVGTIVSSLNEPKWIEKYAGARRLLPLNS